MLRLFGMKSRALAPELRAKLPQPQSLVDLTVLGGGPRGSTTFLALTPGGFTIDALAGLRAGQSGIFVYQNAIGRFRFSAKCSELRGAQAVFALPARIETLAGGVTAAGQKRSTVRLDATVPAQWRFAHAGKGQGDFVRAALTDISRSGASLIVDRELKRGGQVEVRFSVSTAPQPLVLLGEVMRAAKIEASGKVSLGLRFAGIAPEEDRAIMEFINKRQAERRSRGLV